MRIVLLGPTGSGKSILAYQIAKKINGEIVSADSRQVYRYLNIGTNKEIFSDIRTHLIDMITPKEVYSVYDFKKDANKAIKKIESEGKVAIITGGTNFYIKSLIYNIDYSHSTINPLLENKSKEELWELLKDKNLTFFNNLNNSDKNNIRRLKRYLSLDLLDNQKPPLILDPKYRTYSIDIDLEKIKENIEYRTHEMIKKGLIEETVDILDMGFSEKDPGFKITGYSEVIDYKNNIITNEKDLEERINRSTYRLAKKQRTFEKGIKDRIVMESEEIIKHIEKSHF
jgi:tRNA dimethylallyltransferase